MSLRYTAAWLQDGAFNPLTAPTPIFDYTYELWSWGKNAFGQLALNNTTNYSSPKQVGTLTNWLSVASGYYFATAIKTDGTLWTWGKNTNGELGLGNTTDYSSPKQVGSLTNWLEVSCGYVHNAAIKTDGTLWSWGRNTNGQLGLGDTANRSSPVQVGAGTTWVKAKCGYRYSFAIKTDGTMWAWGQNNRGQLGFGNTTDYSSPKQVGALTNWLTVVGGYRATVAVKTDGTLWSWGSSELGSLGLGNTTDYSSPKQVGSLTNWTAEITINYYSPLAIKSDGTLWTWGSNAFGELGLGNTTAYSSPKQIGALTTWSKVGVINGNGGYQAFAIRSNGTLWSWGQNDQGQLGSGNTTTTSTPAQVGLLTTWYKVAVGPKNVTALKY